MKIVVNLPMVNGMPGLPKGDFAYKGCVLATRLSGNRAIYIFSGTAAQLDAIQASVAESSKLRWSAMPSKVSAKAESILSVSTKKAAEVLTWREAMPGADIADIDGDSELADGAVLETKPVDEKPIDAPIGEVKPK